METWFIQIILCVYLFLVFCVFLCSLDCVRISLIWSIARTLHLPAVCKQFQFPHHLILLRNFPACLFHVMPEHRQPLFHRPCIHAVLLLLLLIVFRWLSNVPGSMADPKHTPRKCFCMGPEPDADIHAPKPCTVSHSCTHVFIELFCHHFVISGFRLLLVSLITFGSYWYWLLLKPITDLDHEEEYLLTLSKHPVQCNMLSAFPLYEC